MSAVRKGIRSAPSPYPCERTGVARHVFERRVEDVEGKASAGLEMVDDAAEAGHLIVGGQIVKERAKRRDHKCEAAIQGERTHIARGNGHALLDVGRQRGE